MEADVFVLYAREVCRERLNHDISRDLQVAALIVIASGGRILVWYAGYAMTQVFDMIHFSHSRKFFNNLMFGCLTISYGERNRAVV